MDRARAEDDVIIEHYGRPRVALINFNRYERLVDAERQLLRLRLQQASAAATAQAGELSNAEIDALIESARDEV